MNRQSRLLISVFALTSALPGCGGDKAGHGSSGADQHETSCGDGKDDDGDGRIDCDDLDCRVASQSACELAPPLDRTVATTIVESAAFLYSGPDPLQRDVDKKALDPKRLAIVRGKVSDATGEALAGVKISVIGHPELGWTETRGDGVFDMVVNGGGRLVFAYGRHGYVAAQRSAEPQWQRYASIPEVGMIRLAEKVSAVSSGASSQQVALAEPTTDAHGSRQPLVLFAPGTNATAELSDASSQELASLNVHVTEYPMAEPKLPTRAQRFAPGSLPGSGNISYTLEFTVDEAEALGASRVTFDKPVTVYVENFLGLKAGSPVPLGYYNRSSSNWEADGSGGVVVQLMGVSDGLAQLDTDGDEKPDNGDKLDELGITVPELTELAGRYQAGQSFWRTQVTHFSAWDYLWPVAPPAGASALGVPPSARPIDNPSLRGPVLVEKQVMTQNVGIAGTPFSLHYQSNRTSLFKSGFRVNVPLINDTIPTGLKEVVSYVSIAGQEFSESFKPAKNANYVVDWDGTDAFGRLMQGRQTAHVSIAYVFKGSVSGNKVFGVPGLKFDFQDEDGAAPESVIWQDFEVQVGAFDAAAYRLGGFSLDTMHTYDPATQTLYFGDGRDRSAQNIALVVSQPGKGFEMGTPDCVFVAPDGSVIVSDDQEHDASAEGRLLRIAPDQTVTVIAGRGAPGAAADISLGSPQGIAMASDGSIVYADFGQNAVRSISPDGSVITLIGPSSDGPVVQADLGDLDGIAFGARGELYIVNADQILKLEGGQLSTFAGGGTVEADEVMATQVQLVVPSGLAVGTDGSVYVSERGNPAAAEGQAPPDGGHRVRKITPDGVIHAFAGTGKAGFQGDGLDSRQALLSGPRGLTMGPDGSVYVADQLNHRIRRITPDGIISTVIGGGDATLEEGQLAQKVVLDSPDGIAAGKDGTLFVAAPNAVYRAGIGLRQFDAKDNLVPSQDGRLLYRFDLRGKHQETIDAKTGVALLKFNYDGNGLLSTIVDNNNSRATNFLRDKSGAMQAILAPFKQQTIVTLDSAERIVSISDPLVDDDSGTARTVNFAYDDAGIGLLRKTTDSAGYDTIINYDDAGRVSSLVTAGGYSETFVAKDLFRGAAVDVTTASGKLTSYSCASSGDALNCEIKFPDSSHIKSSDQVVVQPVSAADGTRTTTTFAADEFFGAQALNPSSHTVETPGGRTLDTTIVQSKHLVDPSNALSVDQWSEAIDINGRAFSSVYTRKDRTKVSQTAMGRTSSMSYDSQGRVTDLVAPGLPATHWTYGLDGEVLKVSRTADGQTRDEVFTYDSTSGFMDGYTDISDQTTKYTHDKVGRLLDVSRPDGTNLHWSLDHNDRVTQFTPPDSEPYNFAYHEDSPLLSGSTPPSLSSGEPGKLNLLPGEQRYTYGKDLELTRISRSDGSSIAVDYDKSSRVVSIGLAAATISMGYDANGTLTSVSRSDGVRVDTAYDGPLWISSAWSGAVKGKVVADYDANFWLASVTVNGASSVSYDYDDDGLLVAARANGAALSLARDPSSGFVTGTSLGATTTAQAYNGFGEPLAYSASYQGGSLFSEQIVRNQSGRIQHITTAVGTKVSNVDYEYDALGRLVNVTRDGIVTGYEYDSRSNRASVTVGNDESKATYDEQDRLVSFGSSSYESVQTGDLFRKTDGDDSIELTYDELGNLMNADVASGATVKHVSYVVDGLGRRVARRVNGSFDRAFLYQDDQHPVAEIASDGTFSHFVYATGTASPDMIVRSGIAYRVVKDHLGSVRLVVNTQTGVVAQKLEYDEFGRVLDDTNPGFQPFSFGGGLYDAATSLTRFGVRDYDAVGGRWVSKDPSGFAGGANLYEYAASDPVNFVDLDGQNPLAAALVFCEVFPAACAIAVGSLYGTVATAVYVSRTKTKSRTEPRAIPKERARREFENEVRWQAQGGGTEKSVKIRSHASITGVEGIEGLEMLRGILDKKELTIRLGCFADASRFVNNAVSGGGVGPMKRAFELARGSDIRVDINVESGVNLVPGLSSGAMFEATVGVPR